MGFKQKISKEISFNSIYKITRPTSQSWILPNAKTYNASWTLVIRKRSRNHFCLHFTSKTPYSFQTRGILSTYACHVHGRLTISDRKETTTIFIHEDVYWQWSVPENPKSRIKPCRFSFKPPSPGLLFFKMNSRQEYRSKFSFYKQQVK